MGNYINNNLTSGEEILMNGKVSLWSMWYMILLGVALLLTKFIGIVLLLYVFAKWHFTELATTNKKIIAKYGILSRNTVEIILPKVESLQVQQGIFGRIFNYGTIIVSGTGASHAPISGISRPLDFRRRFLEIQEAAK